MKKTILLITLLFCMTSILNSQTKLSISDFYCICNEQKIKLGQSLLQYDSECETKDFQIIKFGKTEYKMFEYKWGKIYVPKRSKDFKIFGIEIKQSDVTIFGDIKIGSSKTFVKRALGKPYREIENSVYYYNDDFDVLELKISFDNDEKVSVIRLFLGT